MPDNNDLKGGGVLATRPRDARAVERIFILFRHRSILRPDLEFRPSIHRTRFPTLIPRGKTRGSKERDKPKTSPSSTKKPRIQPRQKRSQRKNWIPRAPRAA